MVNQMVGTKIYLRTSTQEQNPENQLKDCLSINRWGEYKLITEQQSAFKDHLDRALFEELKKDIKPIKRTFKLRYRKPKKKRSNAKTFKIS